MEGIVDPSYSSGDRVVVIAVVAIDDLVENGWVHDADVVVSRCE